MAGNSYGDGRSVVSKLAAILRALSGGEALSVTMIAAETGLPISTVHRLAQQLAAAGLLVQSYDGKYSRGTDLTELVEAQPHAPPSTWRDIAIAAVDDLAAVTSSDVRFGMLIGSQVHLVDRTAGQPSLTREDGSARLPIHATALGKALLAFAPPATLDTILGQSMSRYTRHTVTAPDQFRQCLATVRATGLAVSRWELRLGASSIAVPVSAPNGCTSAGLELQVGDLRNDVHRLGPTLRVAARSLSRELIDGARSPAPAGKPSPLHATDTRHCDSGWPVASASG